METNVTDAVGTNTSIMNNSTPGAHDDQNSTTPGNGMNMHEH